MLTTSWTRSPVFLKGFTTRCCMAMVAVADERRDLEDICKFLGFYTSLNRKEGSARDSPIYFLPNWVQFCNISHNSFLDCINGFWKLEVSLKYVVASRWEAGRGSIDPMSDIFLDLHFGTELHQVFYYSQEEKRSESKYASFLPLIRKEWRFWQLLLCLIPSSSIYA